MREWIESRTPPAPPALKSALVAALARGGSTAPSPVDALVDSTLESLDRVLASGASERTSALDLLSSDAFVTYAFEAAADEPSSVTAKANEAMRRISDAAVSYLNATP